MKNSHPDTLFIGLDVGSTTVKAVVIQPSDELHILWHDYRRHGTRQHELVLEFLKDIERAFPGQEKNFRIFITGSGGRTIAPLIGAIFVQEVNALSLSVEKLHPQAGSVIELGGQDAKIIIWIEDPTTGVKRKLTTMNDKCAGGTGAVIDRIAGKLNIPMEEIKGLRYAGLTIHPVAGKCGVFAETDINSLQKQGIPKEELMASLFEALVQQNLSVLTRGNTLRPHVLLLGGPNTFVPGLVEAWRHHIPLMWKERNFPVPDKPVEELIYVPGNALYYAALGAAIYGMNEEEKAGKYKGRAELEEYLKGGKKRQRIGGLKGLVNSREELEEFKEKYRIKPFVPPRFLPGETVEAYIGIDGGSTSTKGVLLNQKGDLLARSYILSKGNPIDDTKEILKDLRRQIESQGARLVIKGMGTTGYAKDMLKECFNADVALVETVAHTNSALYYFDDVDVIVDVGGQDIKVIFLKDRKVRDFRLNTQCSAGNGYFLQSTAERFGFHISEYAERAFMAERMPQFHFGCAVFLESDIVNFQQQGWEREEIMAGLAHVLPKNIWLYVVQEPNLRRLGKIFVLQGGTQYNLAAVKAQYDFIKERVPEATIYVHKYTGESGAIGAALEAIRVVKDGKTKFIGLDAAEKISFRAFRDESTRCHFCQNKCQRTFIDIMAHGEEKKRRYIIATCEKGEVEDIKDVQNIRKRLDALKKTYPDISAIAAKEAFNKYGRKIMDTPGKEFSLFRFFTKKRPSDLRIGIPRTLNMYSVAPFFIAYFVSLGIDYKNIIFSDYTSDKMYREGSRRGAIDACFPSKVALSHIHNLIYKKRPKPHVIFFPILLSLPSELKYTIDSLTCPTVAATPEVVKAAFTKEEDAFRKAGIRFLNPHFNMAEPDLFEIQMYKFGHELLGISRRENREAMGEGFKALEEYKKRLRSMGREVLERLEREGKVGIVLLGRPYHNDPGLNHEILAEIQKHGYPVFTIDSLPVDQDILERLFASEVREGYIKDPMDIGDVWKNSFSENTNRKLWASKYVARHKNLVAVDLSNFRCGHDAPIYAVVEEIVSATHTPYFTFHDIDENKPTGSIKIRIETIDYFLKRYEEEVLKATDLELMGV